MMQIYRKESLFFQQKLREANNYLSVCMATSHRFYCVINLGYLKFPWINPRDNMLCLNYVYGPSFAADIIKEAKKLMIAKGHTYYQSKKLDRVPKEAVEELLGITLPENEK